MSAQGNDHLFCQEQASRGNRLFRVSHVFADPAARAGLLPLHALFSCIEQICAGTRDEGVAESRLAWWQQEIGGGGIQYSSHPVLKEWVRTGVSKRIPANDIYRLFQSAHSRLDGAAPVDRDALRTLCIQTGLPLVELELAQCEASLEKDVLEALSLKAGLAQLIRESAGGRGKGGWWWLPLNLLAKHGVSRSDIEAAEPTSAAAKLIEELLRQEGWKLHEKCADLLDISSENQELRHLFVLDALYAKRFKNLCQAGPYGLREGLLRAGRGDVLSAWRAARAFNRRK